jgi:hypothetical protein
MMRPALWPESLSDALEARTDELKAAAFRGLVSVDLQLGQEEPLFQPTGQWQAGWPMMHTHAFVSDQGSLGAILSGMVPEFPKRFTQVVAVSVPPWPLRCNVSAPSIPIRQRPYEGNPEGRLTPSLMNSLFFHDMKLLPKPSGEVMTAGLDGLVAVARGSGNHLGTAREQALRAAGALALPEMQLRGDAGGNAEQFLAFATEGGLF